MVFLVGVVPLAAFWSTCSPLRCLGAVTRFAHQVPTLVDQAEHGRGSIGTLLKPAPPPAMGVQERPEVGHDVTKLVKPAQALSVGAAAASTLVGARDHRRPLVLHHVGGSEAVARPAPPLAGARSARVRRVFDEVTRSVAGYVLGNR